MRYCYNNNVPIVAFVSSADNKQTGYCVHCRNFATYVLPNPSFIEFVKNNTSCVIIYVRYAATASCKFGNYNDFMELAGDRYVKGGTSGYHYEKGTFVIMLLAWRQKSGNVIQYNEEMIESLTRLPANVPHLENLQSYAWIVNNIIVPNITSRTAGFNA